MLIWIFAFILAPLLWSQWVRRWQRWTWRDVRGAVEFHSIFSGGLPGYLASVTGWMFFSVVAASSGLLAAIVTGIAREMGPLGLFMVVVIGALNTLGLACIIASVLGALSFIVLIFRRYRQAGASGRVLPHAAWPVNELFVANSVWLAIFAIAPPVLVFFVAPTTIAAYFAHATSVEEETKAERAKAAEHERLAAIARGASRSEGRWGTGCRELLAKRSKPDLPREEEETRAVCQRALAELTAGMAAGPFLDVWKGKAPPVIVPAEDPMNAAWLDRLKAAGLGDDACALLDTLSRGRRISDVERMVVSTFRADARACVTAGAAFPPRWAAPYGDIDLCRSGLLVHAGEREGYAARTRNKGFGACVLPSWAGGETMVPAAFERLNDVEEAVNSHLRGSLSAPPPVAACYDDALRVDRSLHGEIELRFEIARSGTPTKVSVNKDALRDPVMARCLTEAARSWRFPAPSSPVSLDVPLRFDPVDGRSYR